MGQDAPDGTSADERSRGRGLPARLRCRAPVPRPNSSTDHLPGALTTGDRGNVPLVRSGGGDHLDHRAPVHRRTEAASTPLPSRAVASEANARSNGPHGPDVWSQDSKRRSRSRVSPPPVARRTTSYDRIPQVG